MTVHVAATTLDSIKNSLVALRMPRALEVLDATIRRLEQGQIDGIEALDQLLIEELTVRENRRVRTALTLARLTTVKSLAGFDFAFQPSLDRQRILALAELTFIDRAEVVHLLGPPGTGKTHLASALAVEAVKAGRSVYFSTLADIIASLAKAEHDGQLRERIRYLCRASLLVVDEIGYLPITPGGGNLFFQLVNARYEKGAMIIVDDVIRECLASIPDTSISGLRVSRETERPHSSLGYATPAAYARTLIATGPDTAPPDGSAPAPVARPAPHGVTMAEALIAAG